MSERHELVPPRRLPGGRLEVLTPFVESVLAALPWWVGISVLLFVGLQMSRVILEVLFGREAAGHGPDGGRGVARIPDSLIDSAVEAAEECPGECIMIEPYAQAAIDARGV